MFALLRVTTIRRGGISNTTLFNKINSSLKFSQIGSLTSLADPVTETKPPRKPRRLFRKLILYTLFSTGVAAGALYSSKILRDLLVDNVPQAEPVLNEVEKYIGGWYTPQPKLPKDELSQLPFITDEKPGDHFEPTTKTQDQEKLAADVYKQQRLSTVDEALKIAEEREKASPEYCKRENIEKAVIDARRSVQTASESLERLAVATSKHTEALRDAIQGADSDKSRDKKWDIASKLDFQKDKAQDQSNTDVTDARRKLDILWDMIDQYRIRNEALENDTVPNGITAYGDMRHKLSGSINKVRKLQNELHMVMRYRDLISKTREHLQQELDIIHDEVDLTRTQRDASSMTTEELNALITAAHAHIGLLRNRLADAEEQEKTRLQSALEVQRHVDDELSNDLVERELERERIRHELEKHKWSIKAKEDTDRELRMALSRHSDHLTHLLRLKEEEKEHQFTYRLREALTQERVTFEAALYGWIKRMQAIEDVVDGRAELDRLAKETQALWIAAEAFASSLNMSSEDTDVTGPLNHFVDAVKEAIVSGSHPFATTILDQLPVKVTESGIWTERGLRKRFEKVHKICRRVAMIEETGGSLWAYILSWLQSTLLFERFGTFPWSAKNSLIKFSPEFDIPSPAPPSTQHGDSQTVTAERAFHLLRCANSVMQMDPDTPNANISSESYTSEYDGDDGIKLAVQLLGQLRGQARLVAADWLEDARLYLEVRQAAKALIAYAAARGLSTYQKRL